jgi:hypothetical protein
VTKEVVGKLSLAFFVRRFKRSISERIGKLKVNGGVWVSFGTEPMTDACKPSLATMWHKVVPHRQ